jgi:hypothetical protein
MAGVSRLPAVRCYGGTVAYGYDDEYDHGRDLAPPPVCFNSGMPNQYVYDEPDNDDYKVFPPPGPGTVIESTGHGYTIVPMTVTTCDKGEGDDGLLVAAVQDGGVVAAAPGGGAGVEADDEDEPEGKLDYEYEFYDADDDLAEQGQPRRGTLATAWMLAGIAAAAEHGRHLTEPATRLTAARRLVHVGGREADCTQRQISLQQKLAS